MRELPEGWGWKKLGEIGTIVAGGTPSTSEPTNFDGDISWITPADLSGYTDTYIARGRRNLSQVGLGKSSAKIVPKGTVLFTSRAPIGYVAIASQPLATNQGFKNLILEGDNILPEYIYYYLKSNQQIYSRYASGTTFLEISASKFSQIPAPIPPLDTQRKIVAILDKAEETRRLRARANELTQTLLQSVFLEMFGDPLENPHNFPTDTIMNLSLMSRYGPRFFNQPYSDNGTPILRTTDISEDGQLSLERAPKLDVSSNDLEKYRLMPGDVVISRSGSLGRCALFTTIEKDCIPGAFLLHYRFCEKVHPEYIHQFILTKRIQDKIQSMARVVAQPNINAKEVGSLLVPIPPMGLQMKFIQISSKIEEFRRLEVKTLQEAEMMHSNLLNNAFTGELVA